MGVKGYKAVHADGAAKHGNEVYEVGEAYRVDGKLVPCLNGIHFCERCADVFGYYSFDEFAHGGVKVLEVEATGRVAAEGDKSCTDELRVLREVPRDEVLALCNSGAGNSGLRNSGNWNSGNWNSGNGNSGNGNSGDWNSGNGNSGNWNSGDGNSGNGNLGNGNSGDWNSGNGNSGNWNSGDGNATSFSSGVLCTEEPECLIFDEPSGMTLREWRRTRAAELMGRIPFSANCWVDASAMSDAEKAENPGWEARGGYLRRGTYGPDFQGWWDGLSDEERAVILAIPNFDAAKWERITGIDVDGAGR